MRFQFIKVMAIGMMTSLSTFANTSIECSQQNSKFLEVVNQYQSCNSPIGGNPSSCEQFCSNADKLLSRGYPTGGASCSSSDISNAESRGYNQGISQGREQGRNDIIRDLSIREEFLSPEFYGINQDDCRQRAAQSTQRIRMDAIAKCNNKASNIKNCFIKEEKLVGQFSRPPKFDAHSKFEKDDNESTEDQCRRTALANAQKEAVAKCSQQTGSQCTIIDSETILTYRIEKPSGPRFGRRDQRVCEARVFAEAPRDLTYKCSMRVSVRNQYLAD